MGDGRVPVMMTFADVLGYSFRKCLALAIEQQGLQQDFVESQPRRVLDERELRVLQRPWAGGGPLDEFRDKCPLDFVVWYQNGDSEKVKIRGAMDFHRIGPVARYGIPHGMRADDWWRGSSIDVWLKTSMLTFNRVFPHEINRFEPALCDQSELSRHLKFAAVFGLENEFSENYLARLPVEHRAEAQRLLAVAKSEPWLA